MLTRQIYVFICIYLLTGIKNSLQEYLNDFCEQYTLHSQSSVKCNNFNGDEDFFMKITCRYNSYYCNYPLVEFTATNSTMSKFSSNMANYMKSLKILNLTHNHINTLEESSFGSFNSLANLDVSYNKLIHVDILKTQHLQYLNLSNNLLTENVLTQFSELPSLTYLDLSYNVINSLDTSLLHAQYLNTIILTGNHILKIDLNTFNNIPSIETIYLGHNRINQIDYEAFDKSDSLKYVDLSYNNISDEFDRKNLRHFKVLTYLDLSHNHIYSISDESLFQSSIEHLELSFNHINTKIDIHTFGESKNLTYLNLSSNAIDNIEYYAFDQAKDLRVIDVSNNMLTNITFLDRLQYAKELYLGHNNFVLFNLVKPLFVITLDIHANNLSYINTTIIKEVQNININGNSMKEVDIICNKKIKMIDISNNKIENITIQGKCPSLKTFNAQNNKQISKIFIAPNEMVLLEIIDFSNNKIAEIKNDTFVNSSSLKVINLSGNIIKYISPGTFSNLILLSNLNISNNRITNIVYGTFTNSNIMKNLDLSNNLISNFDIHTIFDMKILSDLLLDGNQISELSLSDLSKYLLSRFEANKENITDVFNPKYTNQYNNIVLFFVSIGQNKLDCKWLNEGLHKSDGRKDFFLTSKEKLYHEENVRGIACDSSNKQQIGNLQNPENSIHKTVYYSDFNNNTDLLNTTKELGKVFVDMINSWKEMKEKMNDVSISIQNTSQNNVFKKIDGFQEILDNKLTLLGNKIDLSTNFNKNDSSLNDSTSLHKDVRGSLSDIQDIMKIKILETEMELLKMKFPIQTSPESKLSVKKESSNSVLIEICLVMIVVLMTCSVAYYFYTRKYFNRLFNKRKCARDSMQNFSNDVELNSQD